MDVMVTAIVAIIVSIIGALIAVICRYQKKDDWEDIYLCSFSSDYRTPFWVLPHAHYHIILLKHLKCRNVPAMFR
jgi:hypothetical protein